MQRVRDALGVVGIYDQGTATKGGSTPGEFRIDQDAGRRVILSSCLACACTDAVDATSTRVRDAATYTRRTPWPID